MDVSNWDIDSSQWKVTSGTYDVYVGRSSKDIQLTGVVIISVRNKEKLVIFSIKALYAIKQSLHYYIYIVIVDTF